MSLTSQQITMLKQQAGEAMRGNDARAAAEAFAQLISAGAADGQVWYGMALASRALGDFEKAHAAVDQILTRERGHVQALIAKADIYAAQNDTRAAASFYDEAVRAAGPIDRLPPQVAGEVRRAKAEADKAADAMLAHLKTRLKDAGFDEAASSKRFRDSVEILAGKRERYPEEPRVFYFDGLPARGFYDPAEFDWTATIEAASDDIAAELSAAMNDEAAFEAYVKGETDRPQRAHRLLNNKDWSALYLWREGVREEAAARFPKTMAALDAAPLDRVDGRGPMALFSRLKPGTRIDPHTGFLNTRLICHLPLVMPGQCGLRVGADVHHWRKGELCIFNDTIEHEAWNDSDETRIILLFSIWRPELTEEERRLVGALLQSVASFSGGGA
ncbi:aspartyl/asparaginyl beta-hydroxylase domain-containing protein [Hyphococcus luteus]|uniref:Hydroxylase n=1 Tax=Hyphococcus luteus TaxID=2058213 RepID=A0A2S7K861_9PROT|nr:aspartyl/asparaginyl beta-hydroxylase domain-containing protein [Marinicaulis flavus]PQA88676.1 hydroxylase [Marinicaulis flavus]